MKPMKHWTVGHSKEGFFLYAYESRPIGRFAQWLVEQDPCWWGKYKNLPFCLINPWGWTYKIGPEDNSLGSAWWRFGQRLHQAAWRLAQEREIFQVALHDDAMRKIDPEFFEDMRDLMEED